MDSQDLAALRQLVDRMKMGMLTTVADGQLRSRPLQTLELDHDGRLWFFTSVSSPKVQEILREDGQVGLSYG
jgi:general stress protein 26